MGARIEETEAAYEAALVAPQKAIVGGVALIYAPPRVASLGGSVRWFLHQGMGLRIKLPFLCFIIFSVGVFLFGDTIWLPPSGTTGAYDDCSAGFDRNALL